MRRVSHKNNYNFLFSPHRNCLRNYSTAMNRPCRRTPCAGHSPKHSSTNSDSNSDSWMTLPNASYVHI